MGSTSIVILDAGTFGQKADLGSLRTLGDLTIYETTAPSQLAERIKAAHVVVTNKVSTRSCPATFSKPPGAGKPERRCREVATGGVAIRDNHFEAGAFRTPLRQ